ncbi:IncI1 plasmid conjugative transfer protein TraM [Acinetobacter junii CIP 107470 = MTCC 11364]|uniref:IncI1 plasmid conjugative transfer protein TraM n=1 Tax=Acinetobacter junii CIP 107470 = MTCC 11364 TaxID=1217666 RepID=S7YCV0_ACIJU|nr:DotI/IcmL family type IV secretion protein [Acinetobacter junii]ENV52040.1 hypothetical protein F953_00530 [Acinetobacter junii CIP 107470 = MTCC 11364]EPR85833.1 IncI1 plasmid conjugative transfer protein TraM [Acinetobacter junii CIP 107470 = MTCC 11364]
MQQNEDTGLKDVQAKLTKTQDAFDPALNIGKERKYISYLSGAFVKSNFGLVIALIISISGNVYLGYEASNTKREYFASDNGRIFPLIPLSEPYQKPASVIQYARDTLNSTFTLDFLNWRSQLEGVRSRYTVGGFKSIVDSLQKSGLLNNVRDKRMNMTISSGTGVLTKEGVENGRYVWIVEVPIEIKLAGQTTELPAQKFTAIIRVERIPTLDSIEGIGVAQTITKPM